MFKLFDTLSCGLFTCRRNPDASDESTINGEVFQKMKKREQKLIQKCLEVDHLFNKPAKTIMANKGNLFVNADPEGEIVISEFNKLDRTSEETKPDPVEKNLSKEDFECFN